MNAVEDYLIAEDTFVADHCYNIDNYSLYQDAEQGKSLQELDSVCKSHSHYLMDYYPNYPNLSSFYFFSSRNKSEVSSQ